MDIKEMFTAGKAKIDENALLKTLSEYYNEASEALSSRRDKWKTQYEYYQPW
jgi:hypothetical protein